MMIRLKLKNKEVNYSCGTIRVNQSCENGVCDFDTAIYKRHDLRTFHTCAALRAVAPR